MENQPHTAEAPECLCWLVGNKPMVINILRGKDSAAFKVLAFETMKLCILLVQGLVSFGQDASASYKLKTIQRTSQKGTKKDVQVESPANSMQTPMRERWFPCS